MRLSLTNHSSRNRHLFWELDYAISIQKNDKDKTTIHYHKNDLLDFFKDYPDPDDLYLDDKDSKFSLLFKDKEDMQERINEFKEAILDEGDKILLERVDMTIQPQVLCGNGSPYRSCAGHSRGTR